MTSTHTRKRGRPVVAVVQHRAFLVYASSFFVDGRCEWRMKANESLVGNEARSVHAKNGSYVSL